MTKTALGHSHNGSRANGASRQHDSKANGNAATLKRNGVDHESPSAKTNGTVPKGNGVLEDLSEGAVVGEENKTINTKEPSSTGRSEKKDDDDEDDGNNTTAREGRKQSSVKPPSTGPSK